GAPGAEPPEGGGQTAVFSRLDAVAHRAVIAMDRVFVRRVVPRDAPSDRLGRIVDLEAVARAGHDLQPQPSLPATLRPEERRDGVTRTPTLERAAIRPIADRDLVAATLLVVEEARFAVKDPFGAGQQSHRLPLGTGRLLFARRLSGGQTDGDPGGDVADIGRIGWLPVGRRQFGHPLRPSASFRPGHDGRGHGDTWLR